MSSVGDAIPEFRSLLWLAVAMALCSAPFVTYMPLWLLPLLGALGWWRLWRARHGYSAPPGAKRGLIAVAIAGSLIASGNIGFGLESAIPLYVAFLWLKLLEVKNERDLFMTAYLTCFLAGASVLLDQGLGRTAYSFVTLFLTLTATIGHHLRSGRHAVGLRFALRRAGVMLMQAAPAAAVLFLLIPRPHMPFSVERGHGTSGISEKLRPGDFDKIALSQEVAFRVTFPVSQMPSASDLYWRGLVLTGTDGIGWYREPTTIRQANPAPVLADDGQRIVQEITLLPHLKNWLYALDTPQSWSRPTDVSLLPGTVLSRNTPVSSPLTYRVSSDTRLSATDSDDKYRRSCLLLPEAMDPRLGTLANAWREKAGGVNASAAAITNAGLDWFTEQGFTYSLEPGAMDGDPISTFLFSRRSGFCSHYSSAFATLMRLVRIPSRVVVGYRGGEWNDLGEFLAVRQAHAHAWCEVWEASEQRWLRVDPTSAVVVGEQAERLANDGASAVSGGGGAMWSLFRSPRKWWDYLDTTWENWMFRYDGSMQAAIVERLGLGSWTWAVLITAGVLGAGLCLAIVWLALRRRSRKRDPVARLYQRWCDRIGRTGCIRRANEAPLEFATRASLAFPDHAPDIHAVTAAYCDARYGTADIAAFQHLQAVIRAGANAAKR